MKKEIILEKTGPNDPQKDNNLGTIGGGAGTGEGGAPKPESTSHSDDGDMLG